jgi:DNA-directed RNA polymerase subunit RPC12/RpoP
LYIYAGEDLPEGEEEPAQEKTEDMHFRCADCGAIITPFKDGDKEVSVRQQANGSMKRYGKLLCMDCRKKLSGVQ